MNQMPPTQTQSLSIQHHHHHQHQQLQQQQQQQPQKQMQHHNSLPPSNSIGGSWYGGGAGVGSGHPHGGPPPQQTMGLGRNYPPNPDAYAMTTSAAAGARNMVQFYEGGGGSTTTTMQKGHVTPSSSSSPEYNRQAMIQGHSAQNGYGLSNGMMLNGYGLNDPTMLDASSAATMATHPMMSPGVGSRPMQVISPSADYYQEQQRMPPLGHPPLYSQQQQQQFDLCLPGQGLMMESVRTQMGPGMGPEAIQDAPSMVCREGRGSLAQQQQQRTATMMMGYGSSSSQRVMPYPNPQQYMQNKRAQYNNVQQRKTYDYDPTTMHQYNSASSSSSVCYGPSGGGGGWPRQSLSLQQRTMASPDGYPPAGGMVAFHVKEEPDPYLHMAVHGQNQWQSNREPAMRNNAFSPPPGNPTPPMTPGSTCMPCHPGPDPSDHIRSTGMRIFRENELYFTFPVQDGMIKAPFQLEHNAPVSCHIFNLNDQLHEWLMARPDLELMLKCFHKEDRLLSTNWPNSVSISLNEVPLMIDRGGGAATPTSPHHPIFLKSICKPGQNALQISVTTCCCSHLFVLQIVHRPSVRSVFQGLITKRLLPASNTIAKIKRLLSQVTMMAPASLTSEQPQNMPLPLTCPLSMQRIVVPSRGRDCQHIQCFDLESYLKLNCHRNHWHCPLCKKMAALDGLEVDQFLWAVLDHPSSACSDAVLLDISANWKPLPRPGAEYGSEAAHVVYKKYVLATAMPLPSPGNYATMTAGKTLTANGTALLAAGSSANSHQKEMSVHPLERHQKRAPTGSEAAPTNYLGCLSQMTNVFLGPDASPSGGGGPPQTSNMEHMGSFPPTPMGSQISQICTPLDGQSLHPRTPSEGHATHPHTPPDGHPFTPLLDSQTQPLYGKTPAPEGHAATVASNPLTPSTTGFDLCSSSSSSSNRRVTGGKTTAAPDGSCSSASAAGLGSNSEGSASERESGKHDRSGAGQASGGGAEGSSGGSMENALMTEDLTKLDFKSNLTLCDDNQDMLSLLPGSFDYDDLSDLTCYLGGGGSSAPKTTTTPPVKDKATNKDSLDDDDDDFMSFLN